MREDAPVVDAHSLAMLTVYFDRPTVLSRVVVRVAAAIGSFGFADCFLEAAPGPWPDPESF
jgi:hypothetical protein